MDIAEASMAFPGMKTMLLDASGLSKDALHIYFGMTFFLAVRMVWRGRWGWLLAWLAALAITLTGEWLDLRGEALAGALQPDSAHWHDIWNTLFWPTVLAVIGRWLHPAPVLLQAELPDESAERGRE